MRRYGWLLSGCVVLSLLPGVNLRAIADDQGDSSKIAPVFEGKFKCSDGYDPDTDASLHPAGQDYRVRQQVNAEAQFAHEKQVSGGGVKPADIQNNPAASPANPTSKDADKKSIDVKNPGDKKVSDKKADDKKDGDKMDGNPSCKDGQDGKNEKDKAAAAADTKEALNPLNQAVFAIQSRRYQNAVDLLNDVIAKEAKNAQAHYLLAVSYVGMRRYPEATGEYNTVIKLSAANLKLKDMAEQGLKRINASR